MIEKHRRIAIVTGGSSGIGRSIVEKLLSDGIAVATISRDPSKLQIESMELLKIKGDVTDEESIKLALERIRGFFHTS
ncbi:MAG: SDR family NAD(P)-dependent oxidoreductase, partial [Nitrososphaerota archaeon]|nr:SDR family NAD(P)-dependent oxidoreductase [Nitrososphaerota archaeon]